MKAQSFLFSLLFAFSANLFSTAKAQVDINDSLALVDLYNSTNGPGWYNNTNWLTTAPVRSWYGITVEGTRVTSIEIYNNNLIGNIPSSIGNLVNLTSLGLGDSQLSGAIPASIGNLVNLTSLSLAGSQLSGSIPSSIGKLVNLLYLNLSYNQLRWFIPSSIGNLVNLQSLHLFGNHLRGSIPASIGNLVNLKELYLYINELSGSIPASIGNLVNLKGLHLFGNHLSGSIPSSIGNLVNLENLTLYNNRLSGSIPPSIGNLVNLQRLLLYLNQLSGTIPSSIGNLVNLTGLSLYNNQLSGSIPASIGNLVNLIFLYLQNNRLSGAIPSSVGNLVNLVRLDFSNNQLSGSIPSYISNLVNLYFLDLSYNQLVGDLPASLRISGIDNINLSHNQLMQSKNINYMLPAIYYPTSLTLSYNHFTFNGLEFIGKQIPYANYAPQAQISIHQHGKTLSVFAGGTLYNNTYKWFRMGDAGSTTIKGDSIFQPTQNGKYYVHVTNAIATQLTLYSDTIDFTIPVLVQNKIAAASKIQANTPNKHFVVYPNPARDFIQVQVEGSTTIILTNAAGKVILTKAINNKGEINVSALASGTYYLQNKTTGETQKVVVLH